MLLRTGIDLVEINRLVDLNPAIRQRFLLRVYTAGELEEAEALEPNGMWASLAGRFAAKEAVAKALGCGIGSVAWQEIEIRRGAMGEPVLKLHGEALRSANTLGLQTWSISISHTHSHAVALAVAIAEDGGIQSNERLKTGDENPGSQ